MRGPHRHDSETNRRGAKYHESKTERCGRSFGHGNHEHRRSWMYSSSQLRHSETCHSKVHSKVRQKATNSRHVGQQFAAHSPQCAGRHCSVKQSNKVEQTLTCFLSALCGVGYVVFRIPEKFRSEGWMTAASA